MKVRRWQVRRWLREHSLRILAIRDTPNAIAGGVAIGIFLGFMPVTGLKTISAIAFAWLTGSNVLAAVLAGALHDVLLPVMPAIYLWEYSLGYWWLSSPHQWPPALYRMDWQGPFWNVWDVFVSVGKPLLLGGVICSFPPALVSFVVTRKIAAHYQRRKRSDAPAAGAVEENPS